MKVIPVTYLMKVIPETHQIWYLRFYYNRNLSLADECIIYNYFTYKMEITHWNKHYEVFFLRIFILLSCSTDIYNIRIIRSAMKSLFIYYINITVMWSVTGVYPLIAALPKLLYKSTIEHNTHWNTFFFFESLLCILLHNVITIP